MLRKVEYAGVMSPYVFPIKIVRTGYKKSSNANKQLKILSNHYKKVSNRSEITFYNI
jgi:hypothetical protein